MENSKRQIVTMEDIAQAAGVSRMTVSRALKKDGLVSERTRQRILKLVDKMNYVPDQMAGSLSTQRSGFVATLVPSINNVHYANMIQGLTETLESISLQVLLGYTEYSAQREAALVESLLTRRPEAIVLPYDGHTQKTVKLLKQSQVPVFQLWEIPDKPIGYTIGFSNKEVAYNMIQELINLGYQNIAFLCETNDEWTRGAARRMGFKLAMEDNGLSAHRMIRFGNPPMSIKDGYFVGKNLQQYYADIDCVFCVSDAPAFGVLTALKEQHIQVPDDIGIAGFGDFEVSQYSVPNITTVKFDARQIGRMTAEYIIDLLEPRQTRSKPPRKNKIDVVNCMRGSTSSRHRN